MYGQMKSKKISGFWPDVKSLIGASPWWIITRQAQVLAGRFPFPWGFLL